MKFETPKMNISMFAAENVVTVSSLEATQTYQGAKDALTSFDNISEDDILTLWYNNN